MPDEPYKLDTIIAVLSLFVSIAAIAVAWGANRRSQRTQERLLEIEQGREHDRQAELAMAKLRPKIRRTDSGHRKLYIRNEGAAEAYNVNLLIGGLPFSRHGCAAGNETIPRQIGAGAEVCVNFLHSPSSPHPPYDVELSWNDHREERQTYRTQLTLG